MMETVLGDRLILSASQLWLSLRHRRMAKRYRRINGHWPRIARPELYSERMLWRKLVDHNPLFVIFSDKLATKEWMAARCPDLPVPRTLWTGNRADDIPDEILDGVVMVKSSHGNKHNLRVEGGRCDRRLLRETTDRWMNSVHGTKSGEWSYSRVEPRLFVEECIGDAATDLIEFSIRASNGRPLLGSVTGQCKLPGDWTVYLDLQGSEVEGFRSDDEPRDTLPPDLEYREPYQKAVAFAARLSQGVDYARFDFLWNGRTLYGGEITVYPNGGRNDPGCQAWHDFVLGAWDLRLSGFLSTPQNGWRGWYAAALRRELDRTAETGMVNPPGESADPVRP